MKFRIDEVIDLGQLERLMQSLHDVTGIPYGIVDHQGNILLHVGHQDICTQFHRVHPATLERCVESDRSVIAQAQDGPYFCPRCPHGLVSCATPLTVEGQQLAHIFMGQVLSEPPDIEFFEQQAEAFGFEKPSYLDALKEVPVLPREKIIAALEFLQQLAYTLASNGVNRLRQLEASRQLLSTQQRLEDEVQERKLAEATVLNYSERLQLLTQRTLKLQEQEQRRLARELHDTVSSNLSLLGIELSDVREQLPNLSLDTIADKLSDSVALLQDTLRSTRDIGFDLHPAILDLYGLLPALENLGEKFRKQTNIAVNIKGRKGKTALPREKALALFRVAQEALVNCAKHSQCTSVSVHLNCDSERIELSIRDDGVGFSHIEGSQASVHGTGLGLLSMKERAAAVGGECRIESVPGHGTQLSVVVPLTTEASLA